MRTRIIWAVTVVTLLACAGCWNRREPELIGVVIGLGVDIDHETGGYRVTAQVAEPLGLGGGEANGGGGQDRPGFTVLSASGRTVFEAMRNLDLHTSRELTFAHIEVVVFSEELARRGLQPVLDLLVRERELRLVIRPVVVEGDVEKLLTHQFPLEQVGFLGLSRQLTTAEARRSTVVSRELRKTLQDMMVPGRQAIIPRVKVFEGEGADAREPGSPTPAEVLGGAAFRDTRMVGWLTGIQIRGWSWIRDEIQRAALVANAPGDLGTFSMEISDASSRLEVEIEEGDVRVRVFIKAEGRIQDQEFDAAYKRESELTRQLAAAAADVIRDDIESALSRAQELRTDIFGFGNLVYRTDPQVWRRLADRWDEEIFPGLALEMEITVHIRRVGYVLSTIRRQDP